jgi:hypothetical protein
MDGISNIRSSYDVERGIEFSGSRWRLRIGGVMSSLKIATRPRPLRPLAFALALAGLAAASVYLGEPPEAEERAFAPPEAPRVVEDWRGNSARLTPPDE